MQDQAARPGLLVIEADADTLVRQGHSRLADELEETVRSGSYRGLPFLRLRLRSKEDVLRARALAPFLRYPAIVLVAHGSSAGVQAARDLAFGWNDVAESLAPLEPRALFAIACYAGSSGPASVLFQRIPTLKVLVGSPTPITVAQAQIPMLEALMWACHVDIPVDVSTLFLGVNTLLTNGVVFRRNREGFQQASPADRLLADLFGRGIAAIMSDNDGNDLRRRPASSTLTPSDRS